MTPTTPVLPSNPAPAEATTSLVPPDEKFWQHYSPHHEFPLSSVTSVALHVLVIALLALAAWVAVKLGLDESDKAADVEAVALEPGGGGGDPEGVPDAKGRAGVGGSVPDAEAVNQDRETASLTPPTTPLTGFPVPADIDPFDIPQLKSADGTQAVRVSEEALAALGKLNAEARKQLSQGVRSQGKGGQGTGGGGGAGTGPGKGNNQGPGDSKESQRVKRTLRWIMVFSTRDGRDYADQLQSLGAILAVPNPANPEQFLVTRDLARRPVALKVEDVKNINRIYWIDDRRESVDQLAAALGIRPVPPAVVAFFPVELEQSLLQKELAYGSSRGRKAEGDIQETRFSIIRQGGGGYRVEVESQR